MVIAIDFDGVIHDNKNPKPGRKMGPPMPGTEEALRLLKSAGHHILIHSCNRPQVIKDFMQYYKLPYDAIWDDKGKPVASWYIDDKGLRFIDWQKTIGQIL